MELGASSVWGPGIHMFKSSLGNSATCGNSAVVEQQVEMRH